MRAADSLAERTRKKPCARPISTPRSSGDTPVRYAGRFDRYPATIGAEVTGVSSILHARVTAREDTS